LLSTTPAELADDVARLAGDEALRQRLADAARARARRFDAPAVVERVEQIYVDVRKEAMR
jgi:glycosyltransferase involved in cell wall biosynthesis